MDALMLDKVLFVIIWNISNELLGKYKIATLSDVATTVKRGQRDTEILFWAIILTDALIIRVTAIT